MHWCIEIFVKKTSQTSNKARGKPRERNNKDREREKGKKGTGGKWRDKKPGLRRRKKQGSKAGLR